MPEQRPHITARDLDEARQAAGDLMALRLTADRWAAADGLMSALVDAIAGDDPHALRRAVADLELLGPTRFATGGGEPGGVTAPQRIGLLARVLDVEPVRASPEVWPVAVYLADAAVHEPVEAAVEALLASAGLTVVARDAPVLGSWFRRMRAAASQAARSPAAREAVRSAVHTADARLLQRPDAEVTALLMQNLGSLITALQPTKDAVARVGAVLVVKVDWTVVVHQLTPGQRLLLDHNPDLESAPHAILTALGVRGGPGPSAPPDGIQGDGQPV